MAIVTGTSSAASSGATFHAPRRPLSVQDWLETRGAIIAFIIAAVSMMLRGAEFYSGGAFHLTAALGPVGTVIFNVASGFGLAIGCELVGSIAGRDWQYQQAQALEVEEQRGMTKAQKRARKTSYEQAAWRAFLFMCGGFLTSFAAAVYFSVTTTGAHGFWPVLTEVVIAAALEMTVAYLGVFKQSHATEDSALDELGADLHAGVVQVAAERIRAGIHTPQDVRLVAGTMRNKRAAERFEAAYLTASADTQIWTTRDIMGWLGNPTSEALRKRVNRRLAAFQKAGENVWKDRKTGGYQIAKHDAGRLFMDDALALASATYAPGAGRASGSSADNMSHAQPTPTPPPTAASPLDARTTQSAAMQEASTSA